MWMESRKGYGREKNRNEEKEGKVASGKRKRGTGREVKTGRETGQLMGEASSVGHEGEGNKHLSWGLHKPHFHLLTFHPRWHLPHFQQAIQTVTGSTSIPEEATRPQDKHWIRLHLQIILRGHVCRRCLKTAHVRRADRMTAPRVMSNAN